MNYEIIPSVLVDDIDQFNETVELCESFAETVQWDLMDGQFVDQTTFNDIEQLKEVDTVLSIEVHLMAEEPQELFADLAKAGVDRVIVHFESTDDIDSVIEKMEDHDFETGLAINPETEIEEIDEELLARVDTILVMTVSPGAAGQAFMEDQLDKVSELRELFPDKNIQVDGGVNLQTIKKAKDAGANIFAVNSAIFKTPDPSQAYDVLSSAL